MCTKKEPFFRLPKTTDKERKFRGKQRPELPLYRIIYKLFSVE